MKRRKQLKLSRSDLATIAGLNSVYIGHIEGDPSAKPSADRLVLIAKALGVSVEWLVTGKGNEETVAAAELAKVILALSARDQAVLRAAIAVMKEQAGE